MTKSADTFEDLLRSKLPEPFRDSDMIFVSDEGRVSFTRTFRMYQSANPNMFDDPPAAEAAADHIVAQWLRVAPTMPEPLVRHKGP